MAYFQTKNPDLGKFERVLQWKIVYYMPIWPTYFTATWYILWQFGIFYGYLVYFHVFVRCTKKNLATLGRTAT
jgi:phosphotransferase system  glucose/maltose/N-acetylglucosamine-specific IIC component